jgi:hypothetical protein
MSKPPPLLSPLRCHQTVILSTFFTPGSEFCYHRIDDDGRCQRDTSCKSRFYHSDFIGPTILHSQFHATASSLHHTTPIRQSTASFRPRVISFNASMRRAPSTSDGGRLKGLYSQPRGRPSYARDAFRITTSGARRTTEIQLSHGISPVLETCEHECPIFPSHSYLALDGFFLVMALDHSFNFSISWSDAD